MNHSSRDAGIPVLTEIISEPVAQAILEAVPANESRLESQLAVRVDAPLPQQTLSVPDLAERARADWSEDEWNRLEQMVRKRVLDRILPRIDSLLEERIRDALADILQLAVGTLANDIRNGLRDSLDDAIAPAIAEELKRLQDSEI